MMREMYRINDLEQRMGMAGFRPLDVMVTGVTGAGKSSTLNAVFEKEVAAVGYGAAPQTTETESYLLNDYFRLWDTPGLGDGVERDKIHTRKIIDLLYKDYMMDSGHYGFIDMALVLIEGSNRDMGTTYRLLNEIITPNFPVDRVLIAINQADAAMKGRHWDERNNRPDPVLQDYLEAQAESVRKRVKEATGVDVGRPVYYSAEKNYHMEELMDSVIDRIPIQRRIFRSQ